MNDILNMTTIQNMKIPEFHTKRLFLRGICLADAESYERHFADYEVLRYLNKTIPWPYPKGGAKEYFQSDIFPKQGVSVWHWGIFLKEDQKECIGCVSLWRKGRPEHRGFWLGKKYWGKGLMTEAVHPVCSYAFNELGFEKLIFSNAVQNTASRRIKEKTGCRFIKTMPRQFVDPQCKEVEIWELTKEGWFQFCNRKQS